MSKKLSIIIPAYNAENYINECLSSLIIEDGLEDLEVVVVNDGSKDKTKDITLEYVKKYPGVFKLVDKENGGYGSAINMGIKNVSGKYCKILDADDWVDTKVLKKLILNLGHIDTSIIFLNYMKVRNGKKTLGFKKEIEKFKKYNEYNINDLNDARLFKIHSLIFKSDLLSPNHIRLAHNCYYTDLEFISYIIPTLKNIYFLGDPLYCYRLGLSTQTVNPKIMRERVNDYEKVLERVLIFYNNIKDQNMCNIQQLEKYIANIYAGLIRVYFSQELSKNNKKKMMQMEKNIRENYSKIYYANENKAIKLFRSLKHNMYALGHFMVRVKERFS